MANEAQYPITSLHDPIQNWRALGLAARFHPTSYSGFVPQSITHTPNFSIIPHGDHAIVDNLPSHSPGLPAIYQESAREEPQNWNYDVDVGRFLTHWSPGSRRNPVASDSMRSPTIEAPTGLPSLSRPAHIKPKHLRGDSYDMQGFDWTSLGTTRAYARAARTVYCKTVHREDWAIRKAPQHESFPKTNLDLFRFRRMNTRHRAWIGHFQLRNALSIANNNDMLYLSRNKVLRTDPLGTSATALTDLTEFGKLHNGPAEFSSTALAVLSDVVVTGSRYGQYALASLATRPGTQPLVGYVNTKDSLICHVELFCRRGQSRPTTAAFASNDQTVRLLDCATNTFFSQFYFNHAINCTSTGLRGQMRLVVGDSRTAYVTSADSGDIIKELTHHNANIHASDWSADGIHFATGAEDSRVLIYDARNWSSPVADILCETAHPRSLHFSPQGGGPASLLIAEAEDVVSVVEVEGGTFNRQQKIDFFGSIAGIDWHPDGRSFWVANADKHYGGLMEFERNRMHSKDSELLGFALEKRNVRICGKQCQRGPNTQTVSRNARKRSSLHLDTSAEPVEGGTANMTTKRRGF